MIENIFETLLSPIIWFLGSIFHFYQLTTESTGFSIILLSITVASATHLFRKWANGYEDKARLKHTRVSNLVKAETAGLKGENRFRVIERVYQENGYHPIQGILSGLSFFVMLPFLIAALFLFSGDPSIVGSSFVMISDLSKPDALFMGFSILPFIMLGISVVDASVRFSNDRSAFIRFLVIAVVLLVLVYQFSAAIVLYWTINNLVIFSIYLLTNKN